MSALQASDALPVFYPGLRAGALALGCLLYPFRAYAGSSKIVVVSGRSFLTVDALMNWHDGCTRTITIEGWDQIYFMSALAAHGLPALWVIYYTLSGRMRDQRNLQMVFSIYNA